MNILQILSQTQLTGAEAYAITLSEWLRSQGHSVVIVSNKIHLKTDIPFISREIDTENSLVRWRNVFFLRRYIQENKIQLVHAHSRAAVRVAYWATRGLPVALVSTIHGRQHFSLSKRLLDTYGEKVISVCENVQKSLARDFGMSPRKMVVVGNPVVTQNLPFIENKPENRIALVGRLTGPKGLKAEQFILKVAPILLRQDPELHIDIIGGVQDSLSAEFQQEFAKMPASQKDRIHFISFLQDLDSKLTNYRLIVGAGRVAIASMIRGVPAYALGEYGSESFLTPQNYEEARSSNFGDMGAEELTRPVDFIKMATDIVHFLQGHFQISHSMREILRRKALIDFDSHEVCKEIFAVYKSVYFYRLHPNHIPVLMYHKIPDQEIHSQHRVYVTKDNFEKHLQFFKKEGFTALSFAELEEFRTLQRPPETFPAKPLILTFDDGYVDNLNNAGPLLQKYGMKATLFLLADSSIRDNYWDTAGGDPSTGIMSLEQKREILKYPFEIGSHGFQHRKITDMTDDEAWAELVESKAALEKDLNVKINSFAFTFGITSPHHAVMAQKAGYTFAVNTDTGGLHLEEDPYSIFRVNIFPEDQERQLRKKTSSWYRRYFFIKRKK